ncbi:hypothetical protein FRD01_14560 [Microvenator marinus]|uniref:Uncharacterized protein n=1 Tax=Microvenator marinus TaxID=2600177 RepID=A0A5B8XSA5_9DELT|nr:hypothetical protein [Microvenator marinus]QED28434.1 hypothetical protein FRD01_14560 [Microvenator marinus]
MHRVNGQLVVVVETRRHPYRHTQDRFTGEDVMVEYDADAVKETCVSRILHRLNEDALKA